MSNPYGPKIETAEDWNDALGCCCAMPLPPEPTMLCESKSAFQYLRLKFPYAEPADGEIPQLFATETTSSNLYYEGTMWRYDISGDGGDGTTDGSQSESLCITTVFEVPGSWSTTEARTGNAYSKDGSDVSCVPWVNNFVFSDPTAPEYVPVSETLVILEDSLKWDKTDTSQSGVMPLELKGCPGPFEEGEADRTDESWILTRIDYIHYTLSDPLTKESFISETIDSIPDNWDSPAAVCIASTTVENGRFFLPNTGWPTKAQLAAIVTWPDSIYTAVEWNVRTDTNKVRYRWRVPVSHLGTYFKITWDVLYEPAGWDNTAVPIEDRPVRYSRKDLTVEWEGPGSGAQSDPSWLAGDWYDLPAPEEPGVRKVINIRYEHMRRAGA